MAVLQFGLLLKKNKQCCGSNFVQEVLGPQEAAVSPGAVSHRAVLPAALPLAPSQGVWGSRQAWAKGCGGTWGGRAPGSR